MTRLRIASAVAIMAFLAVPVGMTAWSQDKADPKAAGGDKSELYQQLNLFGDVLERLIRTIEIRALTDVSARIALAEMSTQLASVPKAPPASISVTEGFAKFVWFQRLKKSAVKRTSCRSMTLKFLISEKSQFCWKGPW